MPWGFLGRDAGKSQMIVCFDCWKVKSKACECEEKAKRNREIQKRMWGEEVEKGRFALTNLEMGDNL